jgi:hypothetical protein
MMRVGGKRRVLRLGSSDMKERRLFGSVIEVLADVDVIREVRTR